ncbi:relaxase/mobilization nuclease domain-containing protein [Kineococcus endophyticus]|uniref:Relaxase/mobilization nuclease domain-containing protein n=1 Tax=Kineococcus endophyticus TaxID=1181883 RepID=A0ABV3PDW7_9ACTN
MIPRISKGSSGRAALAYDFGPGRREEHVNPRTVAGNLPGDWRDQGALMDGHIKLMRPEVTKPVWRSSLRAAEQDRTLSDEEWRRIAETYIQRMGFEEAPWTATRHADDHIHLTVSRVRWDGKLLDVGHDYARAQAAARVVEGEHQLLDASTRYDRGQPQVSHGEREAAVRRGVQPERAQMRERVRSAITRSDGSLSGFDRELGAHGLIFKRNQASTGRVSGYSYGLLGHVDAQGGQVWFKGSQLGKDFSWAATQRQLHERGEQPHRPAQSTQERPVQEPPAERARPAEQPAPAERSNATEDAVRRVMDRLRGRRNGREGQGMER